MPEHLRCFKVRWLWPLHNFPWGQRWRKCKENACMCFPARNLLHWLCIEFGCQLLRDSLNEKAEPSRKTVSGSWSHKPLQTRTRAHLFKSGWLTTWRVLQGIVEFPACLRTSKNGHLPRKHIVQVWVLLWGQQGAVQEVKADGPVVTLISADLSLSSQQICKSTSWSGAEVSRVVMTAGERTPLEITYSPWHIPRISPAEAGTKRSLQWMIHL